MLRSPLIGRQGILLVALLGGFGARGAQCADKPSPAAQLTDPIPIDSDDEQATDAAPPLKIAASSASAEHPLAPALQIAQRSLTDLSRIADYDATLLKRERVDGRLIEETIHLKLREKPFSVYLKYGEPSPGKEALFVQGQPDGKLWIHQAAGLTSLVGTVALDPDSPQALQETRYPITKLGMRNMLQAVIDQWTLESRYGEIDVKFYPQAKLRGQSCEVIESTHPRPRRQFRFQKTRLYLDSETRLPVRVEQYGFPPSPGDEPPLEELYEYGNLRTNIGLTDKDFDRANPNYAF